MLKFLNRFMRPVVLFIIILAIEENEAATAKGKTFYDSTHIILVGTGASLLILGLILVLALFGCCAKKKLDNLHTGKAEAILASTPTPSPTPILVPENIVWHENETECASPIYCEAADIFEFPRREHNSDTITTAETIETELHSPVDSEVDSEYPYCHVPEHVDDVYETMNGVPPDNEEYSCAYDYLNSDYVNTFLRRARAGTQDYYEYPQNNRNSSADEYRYAYDWWTPGFKERTLASSASEPMLEYTSMDKDIVDDNDAYVNCQTLSKKKLEEEKEEITLEYVTIL